MDDRSIIQLMKRRPDKGLYEAICKYERLLATIAARVLSNPLDVEECVSDAFVGVWKHIGTLQEESGSLKGYLICAVRNNALNRYRKEKRSELVLFSDELERLASNDNLESLVLDNEDLQVMLELVAELEQPDKEIVLRKHFLFETSREIAAHLDLEVHQVKYRLQRGKAALRESLEKRGIAI